MTPSEAKAIAERLEKITPGPWRVDSDDRDDMEWNNHINCENGDRICYMANGGLERQAEFDANANLIAAAPTDISTLLSAHEADRAEVERLRSQLKEAREKALEEAAVVADAVHRENCHSVGLSLGSEMRAASAIKIAQSIRSLVKG